MAAQHSRTSLLLLVFATTAGLATEPAVIRPGPATEYLPAGIEILQLRDEYSRHYLNEDGTITAYIHTDPIHRREPDGTWTELLDFAIPAGIPGSGDTGKLPERPSGLNRTPPPRYETDAVTNVYPDNTAYHTGTVFGNYGTPVFTSSDNIHTRGAMPGTGETFYKGWARFNTAGIPNGSDINQLVFWLYCFEREWPFYYLDRMTVDPANANAAAIYSDINDNTYGEYSIGIGWESHELPAQARTDFKNRLPDNWFAVGIWEYEDEWDPPFWFTAYGHGGGALRPYLAVTYDPPVPTLTGIIPSSGIRLRTFEIAMTGTNFISPITLNFGSGISVGPVTVISQEELVAEITVTAAASAGTRNVSVTTAGGQSNTLPFMVNNPAPGLAGIAPNAGTRLWTGDVALTGADFIQGTTSANFGAGINVNSVTVHNPNQLTANITITAAAATGTRSVSVTNSSPGGGTATLLDAFTVSNPSPTLASINPSTRSRLWTGNIVFTGTGYIQGVSSVHFGDDITLNWLTVNSGTQLTANITIAATAATGARNVWVTNSGPGGGSSGNVALTINNPVPGLSGLNPNHGTLSENLDVVFNGWNYIEGVSSVSFGPDITVHSVTVNSPSQLTASVSIAGTAATGPRDIRVTNSGPGGGNSAFRTFTVRNHPPTLTSVVPNQGVRLQTLENVVLTGTNFEPGMSANFGSGINASIISCTELEAIAELNITAAAATGTRAVIVTTTGGNAPLADAFTVLNPEPALTGLDPAEGNRLQRLNVTLSGSNYIQGSTNVDFGDDIIIHGTTVNGSTELIADITISTQAETGMRQVSVTNPEPGGGTSVELPFVVSNPVPTLTNANPNFGGQSWTGDVSLTGSGFIDAVTSADFGDGIDIHSLTLDNEYQLTATIAIAPDAQTGPRNLSITNAGPGGGTVILENGFTVFPDVYRDVGPIAVLRPSGNVFIGSELFPRVTVRNFGTIPETFPVELVVEDAVGNELFRAQEQVPVLAGGETRTFIFTEHYWTPTELGPHNVTARTLLPGDMNPDNDLAGPFAFEVTELPPWEPGWVELAPMPHNIGNRRDRVRRGSWLTLNEGNGLIYATKGNKLQDFYAYNPVEDAWTELTPAPYDPARARPLERGCRGVADGNNSIYMVHGNNTLAFWMYDIAGNTWTQLADVPEGPSRRRVRGGGDMVYVVQEDVGYVYFLKGDRTEFFRYNTESGDWEQMADAPMGIRPRWMRDSWLAYDRDNAIFAHKARYFDRATDAHELWQYDIAGDSWIESVSNELSGMPLMGLHGGRLRNRRARDGGAGVYDNGFIYALKGGNSQQFWSYDVAADTWVEADTFPTFSPTTGRRRRINAGAYLEGYGEGVFFALKGNRTAEFWRYVIPVGEPTAQRPERSGVMAGRTVQPVGLSLAPSLVTGNSATLRYSLARPGPVNVNVYDVTGRSVLSTRTQTGTDRHGLVSLDIRSLSAGIYLVQVETDGFTGTRKLVVQR